MRLKILASLAVLTVLTAGAAACGGEDPAGACEVEVSTDLAAKPTITVPNCDPPTGPQYEDIVAGDGEGAQNGDSVEVKYVGVSWSTKTEFDASWDRGDTFSVSPLGQASVIKGWNQGLVGAKVGSRRLLVLPPNLAYGEAGREGIAPNETLVFVVDVVGINGN